MINVDYEIDGFKSPEDIGQILLTMVENTRAQITAEDATYFTKYEPSTYDGNKTGLIDLAIFGANGPMIARIIEAAEAVAVDSWVPDPITVRQNGLTTTHVYFKPQEEK